MAQDQKFLWVMAWHGWNWQWCQICGLLDCHWTALRFGTSLAQALTAWLEEPVQIEQIKNMNQSHVLNFNCSTIVSQPMKPIKKGLNVVSLTFSLGWLCFRSSRKASIRLACNSSTCLDADKPWQSMIVAEKIDHV